jgi:hypothetical protein
MADVPAAVTVVAIVNCKHGEYNAVFSSNPSSHRVQVLCPDAENDPPPHLKHSPEVAAPVIQQHSLELHIWLHQCAGHGQPDSAIDAFMMIPLQQEPLTHNLGFSDTI